MLNQLEATAVVHQRVAGNARLLVVGLREATIDHHELAIGLDGGLALAHLHGHMAIDDVAVVACNAKGVHDAVANLLVVAQAEVVALLLLVGLLRLDEIAFKGGHLRLVEQRAVGTQPQIHEIVDGILLHLGSRVGLERQADDVAHIEHQLHARALVPRINLHLLQGAVGVEGNRGVIEQVVVANAIHAAMRKQHADMLVELLAHRETMVKLIHQFDLLGRELVGVLRVDGGEMAARHGIFLTIQANGLLLEIDEIEHLAVLHLPIGMALVELRLQLKLDDADGLVHESREALGLVVETLRTGRDLRLELLAGVVAIDVHGEGGKRQEVDAIALLKRGEVGVTQREADDATDTGVVARGGSHPQDVVVAPRDVPMVVTIKHIENFMGTRAPVVDVAEDMELVDGQALDDVGDGYDEIVGATRGDDGVDNDIDVGGLVVVVGTLMKELLDDVGEIGGQRLAHLRAGVFARHVAAHGHQVVERNVVPIIDVGLRILHQLKLLLRIIDERAQLALLAVAKGGAEELVHLTLNVARGVLQHVLKRLILSV